MEAEAREMMPRQRYGIVVSEATADDVPEIVSIGTRFFEESADFFKRLTIDVEAGRDCFLRAINDPNSHMLVARLEDTGMMVGFIAFDTARFYTVEKVAHLFLFYVLKEYRLSAAGKDMLAAAKAKAKEMGAAVFYASCTGGIDDGGRTNRLLLNLYRKNGFDEVGAFVRAEL